MIKIADGYVLLARCLENSGIWQECPSEYLKVFLHLLFGVRWKESGQFPRGVGMFAWPTSSAKLPKISRHQWKRCIKWLVDHDTITAEKTTRGVIITFINYELYQDAGNYGQAARHNDFGWDEESRTFTGIKEEDFAHWDSIFPSVDSKQELPKIEGLFHSQPTSRRRLFVYKYLRREHRQRHSENAKKNPRSATPSTDSPAPDPESRDW